MEEWIGKVWDTWISKAAASTYPEAAVELAGVQTMLGVFFRTLGGDSGLQIKSAVPTHHGARRRWLERIAGTGLKTSHATMDERSLQLPTQIAIFPDRTLNRDLYLWLAALAAHDVPSAESWFIRNQRASIVALSHYPALHARYGRLVQATLALRPDPAALPDDEAAQELALRAALNSPGSVLVLPELHRAKARNLAPMPLWLYPPETSATSHKPRQHQDAAPQKPGEAEPHAPQRHRAEEVETPESKHGLLMYFRAESLLSWAEYIKVNRSQDEDPDTGEAAENLDKVSLMQDNERVAARLRFDLDLPAAGEDDLPLGEGIYLPEWDWRTQQLRNQHCRLQYLESRDTEATPLPEHLRTAARRLRSQFASLAPVRRWQKGQADGVELDLDAWIRDQARQKAGLACPSGNYFQAQIQQERDLACLLLADLSLSTDAHANDHQKVIDVIRDSLMLFAEALGETGDNFAMAGFSSLKRGNVRFHLLKAFDQPYDALARGRIQAIRPGYYTRLGAAIRHSASLLSRQANRQRLLLILSDGKPHDLDLYEGRYGIEDTRKSVQEAREMGLRPFCITIDQDAGDYLPHMFGAQGFTVLHQAAQLTQRLPALYAQLTTC